MYPQYLSVLNINIKFHKIALMFPLSFSLLYAIQDSENLQPPITKPDSLSQQDNTQEKNPKDVHTFSLDAIMTTGSKVGSTIESTPGNASITDKTQIKLRPNYRASETLRGEEGIIVPKGRGMETFDTITIRGITNGAIIMLDGVPINDINNNTKMLTALRANELERVEITRGSSSILYGSGGLSGAVNFITRMPEKLEILGSIGYGNPFGSDNAPKDYTQWYASIGDAFFDKKFKIKASYGGSFANGYAADNAWISTNNTTNGLNGATGYIPSYDTTGKQIYIVGDMGKQKFNNHDARLRTNIDIGENGMLDVWINYSNYNYIHHKQHTFLKDSNNNEYWGNATGETAGNGTIPYAFVGGMGNEKYNQVISSIGYKHFFDENELSINISHLYGYDIWSGPSKGAGPFGGNGTQTHSIYNMVNFEGTFLWNLGEVHKLLFGLQNKFLNYGGKTYTASDWRDFTSIGQKENATGGSSNTPSAFIDWRARWLPSLSTSFGVRWDLWQGFGYYDSTITTSPRIANNIRNQFSPKASLNYTPFSNKSVKSLFKVTFGQNFRAPTFDQMFQKYTRNDGATFLGNPNLKPEILTSYDIGFEQSFLQDSDFHGLLKLYWFDSFFTDMITTYTDYTTPDDPKTFFINANKARINGVELSYNQRFFHDFGFRFTYTYTNAKLTQDTGNIKAGNFLPNVPEHSVYVQLYYEGKTLFGSIGFEYASKRYKSLDNATQKVWGVYGSYDAYKLLDARFGVHLKHKIDVSVNITNILNEQFYMYYKTPGRAVFFEISKNI
ncbi:TonB-dependent receptor [Helicobacter didelphidarum]|uniref:TonB-dependent receptor n=1 Tax=Helicobacter didelphidarum TaxID=2040648 RepID=A0A3D8IR95_9HELI|nr:TonB-dependent receptor [Helicobacter didelphidarum]RDU67623.1 TonB-dependent receptor [Helicobacter didelphidarum]